jgi:hypothetical protein
MSLNLAILRPTTSKQNQKKLLAFELWRFGKDVRSGPKA